LQTFEFTLILLHQMQKAVYPLKETESSLSSIKEFLSLERDGIKKIVSDNEYLGFQVFKKWEVSVANLHNAIQNPYMLGILEDEQIISIIHIIQILNNLENLNKVGIYVSTGKKTTSYIVKSGKEISEENTQFPERCVLLKKLGNDKYVVSDFGDFSPFEVNKLLQVFVINDKLLDAYVSAIADVIKIINIWLDSTGLKRKKWIFKRTNL
jgi:hypothetical protein